MKEIKVTMNDAGVITAIQKALEAGEEVRLIPEKKKIELHGGKFEACINGKVLKHSKPLSKMATTFAKTFEQASHRAQGMLRRNRLSGLAEQLGTGEQKYGDKDLFCIGYSTYKGMWFFEELDTYFPEVVYMDRDTAEAVCDALNNEEFEL